MADLIIENYLKIEQNNLPLYIFTLNADKLYNSFEVSRRLENKEEGYQRIVNETKIKKIVSYLSGKSENSYPSIFPNNILVALDNVEEIKNGKLSIKDSESGTKGLVIDGQHRLRGAYEHDINFPLVVIGVTNLEQKHQARLFITINKTQTPLKTSLYLDLISVTSDEDIKANLDGEIVTPEQKAIELVKDLNKDETSVLFGLISETGEEKGKLNLAQMVTLIKPYINYTDGSFKGYSYNDQLKIFINYFNALKVVFENEWDNGVMFKTTVIGGLLKSLGDIVEVVKTTHNNFKENSIIYVLSTIQNVSLKEISDKVGGGVKAQNNFSKRFIKALKDNIKDDEKYKIEL